MPLYVFTNAEHGLRAEVVLPVAEIVDQIVLQRATVPERIGIVGLASAPSQGDSVLAGYGRVESSGGFASKPSAFTADQIKQAWSLPPT